MHYELHGKVPEDESKDLPAIPGVPDGGQWERSGVGTEDGSGARKFVVYNVFYYAIYLQLTKFSGIIWIIKV